MVRPNANGQMKEIVPVTRESLKGQIVSQIKSLILTRRLEVRQKLPSERDLSQQFKVSRVVVREALKSLEQSGLIEIRTGATGGAFVAHNLHVPFLDSVRDLLTVGMLAPSHFWEMGRIVEGKAARLAAERATKGDIRFLRELNRQLLDDIDDRADFRGNTVAFHLAVAKTAGNPLLSLVIHSVLELCEILTLEGPHFPEMVKEVYDIQEALIDAIESRDGDRSEELMVLENKKMEQVFADVVSILQ
jgi:GntR family transcriptional regulator, transcriptional repressor for pyruvate dehydrogenase complex